WIRGVTDLDSRGQSRIWTVFGGVFGDLLMDVRETTAGDSRFAVINPPASPEGR
ncbi:hypothetical protein AMECASPLE_033720, partial [Ameca splendens]